jgi:hypothetical protein
MLRYQVSVHVQYPNVGENALIQMNDTLYDDLLSNL